MENQPPKLAQILQKNKKWKWLGPGSLLGDKATDQYAGLKIFIEYICLPENRVRILDRREGKGVDFATTGNNPLCRKFIDYLRGKAEETQDEKEKQQFVWMINRAEGMLEMKEIGQMNDGILLAYANTFFALGEQAQPKIDVNENSIVGLLEDGFVKSRKENSGLSKIIDGIEGGKIPTGAIPTAPVLPAAPAAPAAPTTPTAPTTSASVTGKETFTTKTSDTAKISGEKSKDEEETTPEGIGSETLFGPLKPEPEPEPAPEPKPEAPKPAPKPEAPTPAPKEASILTQERAEKKVLETTKFKQPVISTGKGTRKKHPKKRAVQKTEREKGKPERRKAPAAVPTPPTPAAAPRRPALPSGGRKIAIKAMKYSMGSVAGGGIIGWAATSASEATAATLAFINFLF